MNIGIDLGTTTTIITKYVNGECHTFEHQHKDVIPSQIFFKSVDEVIIGNPAKEYGRDDPDSLLTNFKKYILNDESVEMKYCDRPWFICDTNIFLSNPNIIEEMIPYGRICWSPSVNKELQGLSNDSSLTDAIQEVYEQRNNRQSEIYFLQPTTRNINDFDEELSDLDCQIIMESLDLKQSKNQNVYLITNDKAMYQDAHYKGIDVFTLQSFQDWLLQQDKQSISISQMQAYQIFLDKIVQELGIDNISHLTITAPSDFNERHHNLLYDTIKNSGILKNQQGQEPRLYIQKEAEMAVLPYVRHHNMLQEGNYTLVYDFGGGTFDVSILQKEGNAVYSGGRDIGGYDITMKIAKRLWEDAIGQYLDNAEESGECEDIDELEDLCDGLLESFPNKMHLMAFHLLYQKAEKLKENLSAPKDRENIQFYIEGKEHIETIVFDAERINKINNDVLSYVSQTIEETKKLLESQGLHIQDISNLIVIGGSSLLPQVQSELENLFGHLRPLKDLRGDLVISQGAALYSYSQDNQNSGRPFDGGTSDAISLSTSTSYDFGIASNRVFKTLIPTGESLPAQCKEVFSPKSYVGRNELKLLFFRRDPKYFTGDALRRCKRIGTVVCDELPTISHDDEIIVDFTIDTNHRILVEVSMKKRQNTQHYFHRTYTF